MPYNEQAIEYVTRTSVLYEILQRTNKCNFQWNKVNSTQWALTIVDDDVWDLYLYKLSNGNSLEIVKNRTKIIAKFTADDDDLFDVFFEEITRENKDVNELLLVLRTLKACSKDFDEFGIGGLKAGGKAIVAIPRYVRSGSGGLEIGGSAACSFAFTVSVGDVTEITTSFSQSSTSLLQPEINLYPWSDMAGIGSSYPPLASRVNCESATSTYIQIPLIPTEWFPPEDSDFTTIKPDNSLFFKFNESRVNSILSHSRYQQKRSNGEDLCRFTLKITYKIKLNGSAVYESNVLKHTIMEIDMLYGLEMSYGSQQFILVPDAEYHTITAFRSYWLPADTDFTIAIEELITSVSVYNISLEEIAEPPISILDHNMVITSVCLDVEFS